MNARKKLVFLSFVALCSLVLNMVFPVGVLADDITPPPDTGTTQTAPTEPPPIEDVAPTEPAPTEPAPTDAPPVLVTVAPSEPPALATVEPSGAAPTDPPVLATVPPELTVEPSEPAAPADAAPADPAPADPADLSEVVAAAADAGVVLADGSGEALQLGTVDAAEALSTGDPTGTLSATAIAGHAGLAAGATFSYYQS